MSNNFDISVLTKDLIHGLNFAASIVEKRPVKPILGNILLSASDNFLTITGSSSDLSIKITTGANVKLEGAATVNILTFSEIVRKLSDQTINIIYNSKDEQLIVQGSSFTSHIATLPADEFPTLDNKIASPNSFNLESKKFLRLLVNSEFAMSTEETRYNLNGIFLNSNGNNQLNATAIDGHRLATVTDEVEGIKDEFGVILPRKTVFEMIKILKDPQYSDCNLEVLFDANRISFNVGNLQITSKLIDAKFPDYKNLIPSLNNNKLATQSKPLSEVVDRVSTITHDKFRAIKFAVDKDEIEISAFGETKGSAREVIDNKIEPKFLYEGSKVAIGFNPRYLLDILKNLEEDEIEIYFAGSLEPILIKPVQFENDRYIIMPMKV